ncbi:MAG: nuclear transport factor 2 family protein [Acidobacteriia bacterium]|nr:nuclear transport factor 2 family protein [Terriglobia bacterium]
MKLRIGLLVTLATLFSCVPAIAQEPVVGVANPESLFTSPDPRLNANKQVALHIMRDLLEANHWDDAGKYLSDRYLQHNPNVGSGLAPVVKFFKSFTKPSPVPEHMKTPVVAVIADGDLVVVVIARQFPDPRTPGKTYTTSWFDMWRIKDGKADEHWDGATITPPPPPKAN